MSGIDIKIEIRPEKMIEDHGLKVIKGKEKLTLNNYTKKFYLELFSLEKETGIKMNQLIEVISYSATLRENLAYYRDAHEKIIKLLNFDCLNELIRNLMIAGYDFDVLRAIRDQLNKTIQKIK